MRFSIYPIAFSSCIFFYSAVSATGRPDESEVRICALEAFTGSAMEGIKCFEEIDPTLNVFKRRGSDGRSLAEALKQACTLDWAENKISARERIQCIRKLENFDR